MKPKVFPEFQGTGSVHADPATGICWCVQDDKGNGQYLKARNQADAVKEAAELLKVPEADIEIAK